MLILKKKLLSTNVFLTLIFLATFRNLASLELEDLPFQKLENYGACSNIAIASHPSFLNKPVPFYIFSDAINEELEGKGKIVLKHCSNGSGAKEVLTVIGEAEFDAVRELTVDIEDFGQKPFIKWAIAAEDRMQDVDLKSFNHSMIKDPDKLKSAIYSRPSNRRIYFRANRFVANTNNDRDLVAAGKKDSGLLLSANPSQWLEADPAANRYDILESWDSSASAKKHYTWPYNFKEFYMQDKIDDKTPGYSINSWLPLLCTNGPFMMAGKPFIYGGQLIGINTGFYSPGKFEENIKGLPSFMVNLSGYRLRMDLTRTFMHLQRSDVISWWWNAEWLSPAKLPLSFDTKKTISQRIYVRSHARGNLWDPRNGILDPKFARLIDVSKYDSGKKTAGSRGIILLAYYWTSDADIKKTLIDYPADTFEEMLDTPLDLSAKIIDKDHDFSLAVKVSSGLMVDANAKATMYIASHLASGKVEVIRIADYGTANRQLKSLIIPIKFRSVSVDNSGNLAVVNAKDNFVYWVKIEDLFSDANINKFPTTDDESSSVLGQTKISELNSILNALKDVDISTVSLASVMDDYAKVASQNTEDARIKKEAAAKVEHAIKTQKENLELYSNNINSLIAKINEIRKLDNIDKLEFQTATYDAMSKVNDYLDKIKKMTSGYVDIFGPADTLKQNTMLSIASWQSLSSIAAEDLSEVLSPYLQVAMAWIRMQVELLMSASNQEKMPNNPLAKIYKDIKTSTRNNLLLDATIDKQKGTWAPSVLRGLYDLCAVNVEQAYSELIEVKNGTFYLKSGLDGDTLNIRINNIGSNLKILFVLDSFLSRVLQDSSEQLSFIANDADLMSIRDANIRFLNEEMVKIRNLAIDRTTSVSLVLAKERGALLTALDAALKQNKIDKKEIESLNAKIQALKSANDEIVNFAGTVSQQTSDQVIKSEATITAAIKTLGSSVSTELTKLKEKIAEAKSPDNFKDTKPLLERMQILIDIKDNIIAVQEKVILELIEKNNQLKTDYDNLKKTNTELNGLKDECKTVVDNVKTVLSDIMTQLGKNNLDSKYKELWGKSDLPIGELVDVLKQAIQVQNQMIKDRDRTIEEQKARIQKATEERDIAQALVDKYKVDNAAKEAEIEKLKSQGKNWQDAANQYQKDLQQQSKLAEIAAMQLQNLLDEKRKAEITYAKNLAEKEAQIKNLMLAGDDKAKELEIANAEKKRLQEEKDALIEGLKKTTSDLTAENDRLQNEKAQLKATQKKIEDEKAILEAQKAEAINDAKRQKEINAQLDALNNAATLALERERQNAAALIEQNKLNEESLRRNAADAIALKNDLAKSNADTAALSKTIASLSEQRAKELAASAELIKNLQDMSSKQQEVIERLEFQVDTLSRIIDANLDFTVFNRIEDYSAILDAKLAVPARESIGQDSAKRLVVDVAKELQGVITNPSIVDPQVFKILQKKDALTVDERGVLTAAQETANLRLNHKVALVSMMKLDPDEMILLQSLFEGVTPSLSQMAPYTIDWIVGNFREIYDNLAMLKGYLDNIVLELRGKADENTRKLIDSLNITSSEVIDLPPKVAELQQILTAYTILAEMKLYKINQDNTQSVISPEEAFLSVKSQDQEKVRSVIKQDELTAFLKKASSSTGSFKQALAILFLGMFSGKKEFIDAITGWNPVAKVDIEREKLINGKVRNSADPNDPTALVSLLKDSFDKAYDRYFPDPKKIGPNKLHIVSELKKELATLVAGDNKNVETSFNKAKLNILIKKSNAERAIQEQTSQAVITALKQKAELQKSQLEQEVKAGNKKYEEAIAQAKVIAEETAKKIAEQNLRQTSISKSLESAAADVAKSKIAILNLKAKNDYESKLINYYQMRRMDLQALIVPLRESVDIGAGSIDILQVLLDEEERLNKWFEYAPYCLPVAPKFDDKTGELLQYELSSRPLKDDKTGKDEIFVKNKFLFNSRSFESKVLLGASVGRGRCYFNASSLQSLGKTLFYNRFDAEDNASSGPLDLRLVAHGDNLVSLDIVTFDDAKRIAKNERLFLVPRAVDPEKMLAKLKAGLQAPAPLDSKNITKAEQAAIDDYAAAIASIERDFERLKPSLVNRKDYEVKWVDVLDKSLKVNDVLDDGSVVMLSLPALDSASDVSVLDYDRFVSIPSYRKRTIVDVAEAALVPSTYINDSIHFVLQKVEAATDQKPAKYRLLDSTKKNKLISFNNQLLLVDVNATDIDTKKNLSVNMNNKKESEVADTASLSRIGERDIFVFSGSLSSAKLQNSEGKPLLVNSLGNDVRFSEAGGSPDGKYVDTLTVLTDEQFFFLEGASSPVDESGVIIRTFSTAANSNMHGFLSTLITGRPLVEKIEIAYSPWVSAEYHAQPGKKETVFSIHRFEPVRSQPVESKEKSCIDARIKAYLEKILTITDDSTIVDTTNGFNMKESLLSGLLNNSEKISSTPEKPISPAQNVEYLSFATLFSKFAGDKYAFENLVNALNDLVQYKLAAGILTGKDSEIIKDFVKNQVLPNVNKINAPEGSVVDRVLNGTKMPNGAVVGGLVNLSEATMSLSAMADGDLVAIKVEDNFVCMYPGDATKTPPVEAEVKLSSASRMDEYANFRLKGSFAEGFKLLDLSGSYKMAYVVSGGKASIKAVSVDTSVEGQSTDLFKFAGTSLYKVDIYPANSVSNATRPLVTLFEQPGKTGVSIAWARAGSFEKTLLDSLGKSSLMISGDKKGFKEVLLKALKENQSKMSQTLQVAIDYLKAFSQNHQLDGRWSDSAWQEEISQALFGDSGVAADVAFKNIDPKLYDSLINVAKIFEADASDFFRLYASRDGKSKNVLGIINLLKDLVSVGESGAPVSTAKGLAELAKNKKVKEVLRELSLDEAAIQERNVLIRFIPINKAQRIYAIACYLPSRPQPSYLRTVHADGSGSPLVQDGKSYSLTLGNICDIDTKDAEPTSDISEHFEVTGTMSSIQIRALASLNISSIKLDEKENLIGDPEVVKFSPDKGYLKFVDGCVASRDKDNISGFSKDSQKFELDSELRPIDIDLLYVLKEPASLNNADKSKDYAGVQEIPYYLYKHLYDVAINTKLNASEKVVAAEQVVQKFGNFIATNIESENYKDAKFKDYLLAMLEVDAPNDTLRAYDLKSILDWCSAKLAKDPISGGGIEFSRSKLMLKIFGNLTKLALERKEQLKPLAERQKEQAQKKLDQEALNRPALKDLLGYLTDKNSGKDFAFAVNNYIQDGDEAGLKVYLQKLLQFLFNDTSLEFDSAGFNLKQGGLSYLIFKDTLTVKDLNDVADRIRRLFLTAFVLNPDHPVKQFLSDLMYKLSGMSKEEPVQKTSEKVSNLAGMTVLDRQKLYSKMTVLDRFSLIEAMLAGKYFVDLAGEDIFNKRDPVEAFVVLETLGEADKDSARAGATKLKDSLLLALETDKKRAYCKTEYLRLEVKVKAAQKSTTRTSAPSDSVVLNMGSITGPSLDISGVDSLGAI